MSPDERREVISLREHLEQRMDEIHADIDELKAANTRIEEKVGGLVSWKALAGILGVISAVAALVFSVADHL